MPPKGKSNAQFLKGQQIGKYSGNSKTINALTTKIVDQKQCISRKQTQIIESEELLESLDKELSIKKLDIENKRKSLECLKVQHIMN